MGIVNVIDDKDIAGFKKILEDLFDSGRVNKSLKTALNDFVATKRLHLSGKIGEVEFVVYANLEQM